MFRGINREAIFRDDEDCKRFMQILIQCKAICGFELFAWCLMGNHVHLLLRTGNEPMDLIAKRLGCRYVYWYNRKYGRVGHLFQDRYRSEAVDDEVYFLTVLRYILQNPLKAKLETSVGNYRWSSYRAYLGQPDGLTDTQFALGFFDNRDAMLDYIRTATDETAMDVPSERESISRAALRQYLNAAESLGNADRDSIRRSVRRLHDAGATIRQIAAATGMSKSRIGRILNEK